MGCLESSGSLHLLSGKGDIFPDEVVPAFVRRFKEDEVMLNLAFSHSREWLARENACQTTIPERKTLDVYTSLYSFQILHPEGMPLNHAERQQESDMLTSGKRPQITFDIERGERGFHSLPSTMRHSGQVAVI